MHLRNPENLPSKRICDSGQGVRAFYSKFRRLFVSMITLTRIFHELPATNVDMGVPLSELESLGAGSRASSGVTPCDVLCEYASDRDPAVAR